MVTICYLNRGEAHSPSAAANRGRESEQLVIHSQVDRLVISQSSFLLPPHSFLVFRSGSVCCDRLVGRLGESKSNKAGYLSGCVHTAGRGADYLERSIAIPQLVIHTGHTYSLSPRNILRSLKTHLMRRLQLPRRQTIKTITINNVYQPYGSKEPPRIEEDPLIRQHPHLHPHLHQSHRHHPVSRW
jgi:hypothetical protein